MISNDVTRAVSCAVMTRPGLSIDDLILCCAPYSWNQVFLALDELVRSGEVSLRQGEGFYMITPPSDLMEEMHPRTEALQTPRVHSQV